VKTQELTGRYNDNFSYSSDHTFNYTYDKSNRLLNSVRSGSKSYMILNTYESAGNITTLKRKNNTGAITDDFNYVYYSGKNKLQRVSSVGNQFSYDANNNLIIDALNNSNEMLYDHRNLITELMHRSMIIDDTVYLTKYYYDEAGNRIRKMIYNNSNDSLLSDNIYSRDVSGRELAIYKNGSIDQWNIYGMDNIGFIDGNEDIRFYMKDHLGSVRAVTDVSGNVVSSQDYDAWGYLLENRVYESDVSIYKFTSKERDEESFYDYFGARYYDARIGRWGQTEPLVNKYVSFTPYQYGLLNPIMYGDFQGMDVYIKGDDADEVEEYLNKDSQLEYKLIKGKLEILTKDYDYNSLTSFEKALVDAIEDPKNTIKLITTRDDEIEDHSSGEYSEFLVGAYMGSKENSKGKIIASQYFNLNHATAYEEAGGGSIKYSIMHEIIEAHYGAQMFPGQNYSAERYSLSHNKALALEPNYKELMVNYRTYNQDKWRVYFIGINGHSDQFIKFKNK